MSENNKKYSWERNGCAAVIDARGELHNVTSDFTDLLGEDSFNRNQLSARPKIPIVPRDQHRLLFEIKRRLSGVRDLPDGDHFGFLAAKGQVKECAVRYRLPERCAHCGKLGRMVLRIELTDISHLLHQLPSSNGQLLTKAFFVGDPMVRLEPATEKAHTIPFPAIKKSYQGLKNGGEHIVIQRWFDDAALSVEEKITLVDLVFTEEKGFNKSNRAEMIPIGNRVYSTKRRHMLNKGIYSKTKKEMLVKMEGLLGNVGSLRQRPC